MNDGRGPWIERILTVIDFIHAHLDDEIRPEQLADLSGFSLHHFHRVFRGVTEESVMGFVRRLRLERAAMRLKYGQRSVTDVAFASGYGSHEAFTRAFRARFGEAPQEFRHRALSPTGLAKVLAGAEVRTEPERPCIAYRYTGPYEGCDAAWRDLFGWAAQHGVAPHSVSSLGLCYDDPDVTDSARLRYDACLVFDDDTKLPSVSGPFVRRTVPGGTYALAVHEGSYETIFETYVALLGRWLPRRSVELFDEPVVEVYLNSPWDTPAPELRTEVCVRVDAA